MKGDTKLTSWFKFGFKYYGILAVLVILALAAILGIVSAITGFVFTQDQVQDTVLAPLSLVLSVGSGIGVIFTGIAGIFLIALYGIFGDADSSIFV